MLHIRYKWKENPTHGSAVYQVIFKNIGSPGGQAPVLATREVTVSKI